MRPGRCFAVAMKSFALPVWADAAPISTKLERATSATGARSVKTSYGGFVFCTDDWISAVQVNRMV